MEQEPKIENKDSLKEEIDGKLRGALRELHGIMHEGIIRVSLEDLNSRIEGARNAIRNALESVEKLEL